MSNNQTSISINKTYYDKYNCKFAFCESCYWFATILVKNKFENYLLFVRTECQKAIERNSHQNPTFLEHYQMIIEIIDWWTFFREN